MTIRILFLLFLFSYNPAFAGFNASIGTSVSFLNINDPNFDYVRSSDQLQLSSLTTGLNYSKDSLVVSLYSNRLANRAISRDVVDKFGNIYQSKTKVKSDTLMIGYKIKRFIPAVFITNATVDKSLMSSGYLLAKTHQTAILGGLNLTYLYDSNISFSAAILAPNRELNIDSGIVFGINYTFL